MPDTTNCPRCGAALPANAAAADCPRCLLAAGLESVAPAGPGDAAAAAPAAAPAPTAPSPEEIGRHFPLLEVLELLGQGGMGIVYKARQKSLDRMVALKVMPPDAAREAGFADRFTREAHTLARLQHPNIVAIHDFGTSDGLYYLMMEYVDGLNLRDAMRAGAVSPGQALQIVPQVCDALQYAHENGVVHRDVKPENILLDRAGRVKIADFGLAKIVQRTPVDVTLTRAGQVMGTLHYMAPEQYRAPDAVDHRADIYSLGVVFYEMLTGELPLGSFPPPSEKAGVDLRMDRVVMRALESERDRRWQSASDVKTRMTEIAAGPDAAAAKPPVVPVTPVAAAVVAPPVVPRASRLATVGGLGVPGAVVLGLLTWGLMRAFGGGAIAASTGASVALAVVFAGWVASMVAWARISHSRGTLGGKSWAVTGTFLPLAFMCCGGPVLAIVGTGELISDIPFGIHVTEGPDGTHVRMPGIDVKEGPDGTHVRLPGISVDEKDGISYVRVAGGSVTAVDRSEAIHVTGGPATLTESDRAQLVGTMRILWHTQGAARARRADLVGLVDGHDITASDFEFFHLALAEDGLSGRLVLTGVNWAIALDVRGDGNGAWTLSPKDAEYRGEGTATDADRDGQLWR